MNSRFWIITLELTILLTTMSCSSQPKERPYLDSAIEVAKWLQSNSIETDSGKVWTSDPTDSSTISTNLYSGSAGVVLFFLEAYRAIKNEEYLQEAEAGADYLLSTIPESISAQWQAGLYTGIAGSGFVLEETFQISQKPKYREGALQCVRLLHESAKKKGAGAEWGKVTDIISGNAGTGLFLLYAAEKMKHFESKDLAIQVGSRLMELGTPEHNGLKWRMSEDYERLMPNFSHGTAGNCYFLASLYTETKQDKFLEGALAGARYLQAITTDSGLVFHHEPEGEELFYLGWCHGPPGTARLYYRLWEITDDKKWLDAVHHSAQGIMLSGIPQQKTPGFWNNVGQCCGSAGVSEFFLSLHQKTGEKKYLEFSKQVTADLLLRAGSTEEGMKWIQAEHRVRPELLIAQTGYMQGAAGIGMWLLRFDAFEQGMKAGIKFPDSPF